MKRHTLTRRVLLEAGATAAVASVAGAASAQTVTPGSRSLARTLFFRPAPPAGLWDSIVVCRAGRFYLFYPGGPEMALATSDDGVSWVDQGRVFNRVSNSGVWSVKSTSGAETFIRAYYTLPTRMRFIQSSDLTNWRDVDDGPEFASDPRWYDTDESQGLLWARWGDLWAIPRPGGGFYGYTVANAKGAIGLGFSESDDGIHWTVRPPAPVRGTSLEPGHGGISAPEVSAVREWGGKYYAVLGLDDLGAMFKEFEIGKPDRMSFRPGHTTMVADAAAGPFYPVAKNRRLLIGNNAYFLRLLDGPDGVLANHHCWETDPSRAYTVKEGAVYLAPLKAVERDDDGTLRLKWWRGNERAKGAALPIKISVDTPSVQIRFMDLQAGQEPSLILEGELRLPSVATAAPVGLYFEEGGEAGTAFLVRSGGRVDFGRVSGKEFAFEHMDHADRELNLHGRVRFRLLRRGPLTEFYINDYLMQSFSLSPSATERIGLVGDAQSIGSLAAWAVPG